MFDHFRGKHLIRGSSSKRGRCETNELAASTKHSYDEAMDRMISPRTSSSERNSESLNSSGATFESDRSSLEVNEKVHSSAVSEHARRLGREAYQEMIDAKNEGDICIVEKSYVITGTPLKDQSLFFCALQNLISMERMVRTFEYIHYR